MSESRASVLPLGGLGLSAESYADFLGKEYLGDYVRSGGAAVRFAVVGDDDVAARWHRVLAATAHSQDFLFVPLDAADVKVHMVDRIYAAVAAAVDWGQLARAEVRAAWEGVGLPAADDLLVAEVAALHEVDAREAARTVRRRLEATVLYDVALARDFRIAALRLCQAELGTGDMAAEEQAAVLAWLRGETAPARALRAASLHGRIGRHNARAALLSLAAWRARLLGTGMVLDIDLGRVAVARRPPLEERVGLYYSKAAVLDAYEVLRQLIDGVDQIRGALIAVSVPPELLLDDVRGLPAYAALQLRIVDEVRDRRRPNPYAALVRLEARVEAVRSP